MRNNYKMRNENERKLSSPSLDFDVGLGLKMQSHSNSNDSSCKRANMGFPFYQYPQFSSSDSNVSFTGFSGDGGGGSLLNQGGYLYEADTSVLPMTFSNSSFRASGSGMYGKSPFTGSQLQEFERQKMIHKYMISSVPVPPQLLLPTSRNPSSSRSGLDLRFGPGGSDQEPWRCKRTDGKKWRCSRDVAPDMKYCERHAHKSKTRSRKHVEMQSHKITPSTPQLPQRPSSLYTSSPYDQTRSIEWFMRGGNNNNSGIPVSTSNLPQWQTVQTSSQDTITNHKNLSVNLSVYRPQYAENNNHNYALPYIPDTSNMENHQQHNSSFLDSLHTDKTQTTRHFIDALGKKFSPSTLSLSMSGFGEENDLMNSGQDSDGNMKAHWLNSVNWSNMNTSPPGGPLGEALCLGSSSGTTRGSNMASPHGYSNNSNTNSSKSSCEDGSHALNFIG